MKYIEKISKLFKPVKEKYDKTKRFKNCVINFNDYKLLIKKKSVRQLDKNETKCLNKFEDIFDVNILKQFSKKV